MSSTESCSSTPENWASSSLRQEWTRWAAYSPRTHAQIIFIICFLALGLLLARKEDTSLPNSSNSHVLKFQIVLCIIFCIVTWRLLRTVAVLWYLVWYMALNYICIPQHLLRSYQECSGTCQKKQEKKYVNCSVSVFKMAVEFLHELNVPFFKVGSGDTNNFPYLKKTAQKGLHSFFFILYFNRDNGQSMTAPE